MNNEKNGSVFTIAIGGAAGDGVREAGQNIGTILTDLGYEVFVSFTYPSLIKGGHIFSRISFSKEKVWSDHTKIDVLIALNEETIQNHKSELAENAVIFADKFEKEQIELFGKNAVILPMSESSKALNASPITRSSVALGAICYLLNLDFSVLEKILNNTFKEKDLETNLKLANIGFEHLKLMDFRHPKMLIDAPAYNALRNNADGEQTRKNAEQTNIKYLVDGNIAFAKGLQSAGLDFYVSYPMTPATSILHFLAEQQKTSNLRVIQPENELSAINMALGISYAGKRVATGTASGGFALMQEAFSFSGIAELPIVIAVSQRQAPATGVPTFSSQTDLRFVIHAGHGEFLRIVIAPGDPEEAFLAGRNTLNLAWRYQIPVIVLLDKIISEHSSSSDLSAYKIEIEKGKIAEETGENYGRYKITSDGISPMAFPGTKNTTVKITSYEHDEFGIGTENAESVKNMIDKRFLKTETLLQELKKQETVKIYGDKDSENVVVFWGGTKGPVLESAKFIKNPIKFVQILWAEPFDFEKVKKELSNAKNIINIECNHNAQMGALIKEKTGIEIKKNILKYDSRPFDPEILAKQIKELI